MISDIFLWENLENNFSQPHRILKVSNLVKVVNELAQEDLFVFSDLLVSLGWWVAHVD